MASKDDLKGMSKLDDFSGMKYVVQGESLVIRSYLSIQVYEEDVKEQR